MFGHEALQSHAATFPSRADEYAPTILPKLQAALATTPEEVAAGYAAIEEWRRYTPDVDLYLSPGYGIDLPAVDVDELEVRLALSSFLRWVNLIGWAGLAIGNLQLVAPADETVLAAGLASRAAAVVTSSNSRLPLLAEGLDALAEVVRRAQHPVREPLELEPDGRGAS